MEIIILFFTWLITFLIGFYLGKNELGTIVSGAVEKTKSVIPKKQESAFIKRPTGEQIYERKFPHLQEQKNALKELIERVLKKQNEN